MTIAFDDVPNPFKRLAGVFEAHVTIAASRAGSRDDVRRFGRWCEALGVKHVLISLPRGACTFQPMTATYHRGGFADVRAEVFDLAREIGDAGFDVSRVKIEATGANSGLPQTTHEASRTPESYFEFHLKTVLRDFERVWLPEGAAGPYLCGRTEPSLCDLFAVCELTNAWLVPDGPVTASQTRWWGNAW